VNKQSDSFDINSLKLSNSSRKDVISLSSVEFGENYETNSVQKAWSKVEVKC
jgi:hypothetical protein